jgi:phosphoribosylformylglycinamidine synthase
VPAEMLLFWPQVEMITPWSTNAVVITQNMAIEGIEHIKKFAKVESKNVH